MKRKKTVNLSLIGYLVTWMAKAAKKTFAEVQQEKSERVMEGIGYWAAFYRENPQRFAADFLNLDLKIFQKILLYCMMHMIHFMYFASRGLIWLLHIVIYGAKRAISVNTKSIRYVNTEVTILI